MLMLMALHRVDVMCCWLGVIANLGLRVIVSVCYIQDIHT